MSELAELLTDVRVVQEACRHHMEGIADHEMRLRVLEKSVTKIGIYAMIGATVGATVGTYLLKMILEGAS